MSHLKSSVITFGQEASRGCGRSHHVRHSIRLEIHDLPPAARIPVTTDKPVYQPGQTLHIRALALGAFDPVPAAGRPLGIVVADGKGNKVFRTQAHIMGRMALDMLREAFAQVHRATLQLLHQARSGPALSFPR